MAAWRRSLAQAGALLLLTACGDAPDPAPAADFAVLAQHDERYAQARPERPLVFPRDHGAHPDFRIEWWYLTANLEDGEGRPYGAQWTLFRLATRPPGAPAPDNPWQSPQVYMAHFAVTTPNDHRSFQRYARGGDHGGEARAGVTAAPFAAWLDDWSLRGMNSDWLPLELFARQDETVIHLELASERPLVLQGEGGFSQKHPSGGGSYYYSQPFLTASGYIGWGKDTFKVSGTAWLDREWSSQFLQKGQQGWDWFALHLDSGEKLMLFQLREPPVDGEDRNFRHGVLIAPDGRTRKLDRAEIGLEVLETAPVAGRSLPLAWQIKLPEIDRRIEVRALHPEQWMDVDFPYWEGAVTASGEGPENRGVGYMELTGYSPD